MYGWLVFLHVAGVFGFLSFHGVSVSVAFQLVRERDPKRVAALIELSATSLRGFYVSLLVLIAAGTAAGFVGKWWGQAWIWTSLALLVVSSILMLIIARPYFRRVGAAARKTGAVPEDVAAITSTSLPMVLAAIGFGTILVILYLMLFKPF